jgi:hypothetical protein
MKMHWRKEKPTLADLYEAQGLLHQYIELPSRRSSAIRLNLNRDTLFAILFSLFVHALLILSIHFKMNIGGAHQAHTFDIILDNPSTENVTHTSPQVKSDDVPETKPKHQNIQAIKIPSHPIPTVTPQIPTNIPAKTPVQPTPPKSPAPEKTNEPTAGDMMSLINQKRSQRSEQEVQTATNTPSTSKENDRDSIIKNNLAQPGTSGIFQLRDMGLTSAKIAFTGWKSDARNAKFEVFEVKSQPNEPIELAIVRKIITIIRRDYSGDFNWISRRGNEVVLSARLEDNAALEQFLLKEFFPDRSFR